MKRGALIIALGWIAGSLATYYRDALAALLGIR